MTSANSREEHLYIAMLSEEAERFEEMVEAMNKVVQANAELKPYERKLFFVAYKNIIRSHRNAWYALSQQQKKEEKGSNIGLLRGYKAKFQTEINKYCSQAIKLIDDQLMPNASNSEARALYFKMKGDFYRYICECSSGAEYANASGNAEGTYKAALEVAQADLPGFNHVRLNIFLNYSVFLSDIKKDSIKACQLARDAFDYQADFDYIDEDNYKEATQIMQILRDNLTLWTSELEAAKDQ